MVEWRNWSGNIRATPMRQETPNDIEGLAELVRNARRVRVVGSGHSYAPLCETPDLLISMSQYAGTMQIAPDRQSAWIPAGWRLDKVTAALWAEGLSLLNQGDIDQQALAGALATGTHGTGQALGSLSTNILAVRSVQADGSIVEASCERNGDLFQAQRLALGLFGVVTDVCLRVAPAYYLQERVERRRLEDVLEHLDALAATTRHMEFFIFPHSNFVVFKTLDLTQPVETFVETTDMDGDVYQLVFDLGTALPPLIPPLQRQMMKLFTDTSTREGPAHRIFPSSRTTRCEEMEYEIPRAHGIAALREALALVRKQNMPLQLPFEVRLVAGDDLWMSPFNNGPAMSISVHQYVKMDWREPFAAIEPIFLAHGGRPHWGKRHHLHRADIGRLYPMLPEYLRVRADIDPEQKFTNEYLAQLLGIGAV